MPVFHNKKFIKKAEFVNFPETPQNIFISPTQRMGAWAFRSSVAPASFAISGIMLSSRSKQESDLSDSTRG